MRLAPLLLVALAGCTEPAVALTGPAPVSHACVGPTPPAAAFDASPSGPPDAPADGSASDGADAGPSDADVGPFDDAAVDADDAAADADDAAPPLALDDPRHIGALAPAYRLTDAQPLACGYGATYGLSAFRGKVVVVAFLAGWCEFCQGQALKLEQLRVELRKETQEVEFVIVNKIDAIEEQFEFVRRTSMPILQDVEAVGAWELHRAKKDDLMIYDRSGRVADYLPIDGPRNTWFSSRISYTNFKNLVRAILARR